MLIWLYFFKEKNLLFLSNDKIFPWMKLKAFGDDKFDIIK